MVLYLTLCFISLITLALFCVIVLWIWNEHEALARIFALLVAALVILTHAKKNIGRILRGVESRVPISKHRDHQESRPPQLEGNLPLF